MSEKVYRSFTLPHNQTMADQRIFVYLLDEDNKEICYWSAPCNQFMKNESQNATVNWISLLCNKYLNIVKEDY